MRPLPALLAPFLTAACSFTGGSLQPGGPGADAAGGPADARHVADARPPDARPVDALPPFCDAGDSTLSVCYAFENNANDGSSHRNDATTTSVDYNFPGQDGLAVHLTSASALTAPDSTSLNPTAHITLEAWIQPFAVPQSANGRAFIIAKGTQYSLYLGQKGQLGCTTSNGTVTGPSQLPTNQWTHVACVFDPNVPLRGSSLILFQGGVAVAVSSAQGALDVTTDPLEIGASSPCAGSGCSSTFDGLIDDLRIYDAARSGLQICQDAHLC